ncbi:hypothetical protein NDU88_003622 [Pleurodeles waltl]|uniref:Uncharacterized protein n=1 Tax=Pleurodeles waltl TaxID=8319 RepID=A0AAV7PCL8_PLEWA|nr:hypothetical protein NDU88_003622 [Pleurodeles waltl]
MRSPHEKKKLTNTGVNEPGNKHTRGTQNSRENTNTRAETQLNVRENREDLTGCRAAKKEDECSGLGVL